MLFLSFLLAFGLLNLTVYADLPFLLGNFPLAVKTPYLHAWISGGAGAPEQEWTSLYLKNRDLGWVGIIRVDDQPYQWLGKFDNITFSTTFTRGITPTRTTFTIQAGPMKFNATFFSPIEPNDYIRQSVPFTYMFVDAFTADDGKPHTVQLYTDIACDWVSHEDETPVKWDTQNSSNMVYHRVQRENPLSMVEHLGQAEDATVYYATSERSGLTWKTGQDADCRNMFAQNGRLDNSRDTNFRPLNDRRPTFALAIDLESILPNSQPDPVIWALGLVRDPLVKVTYETGSENRTGYYRSAYQTIDDVISDFLANFPSARQRGQDFDDRILNAALQVSPEYTRIISLVTRQIFASMDITIPAREGGQPNASDVKIFMKDIGVSARVNPVEVIYAALPALLYSNSSFVHDLLVPLLEFQSSSIYLNPYAASDLGNAYPVIHGNTNTSEELAIEHCGNMLIMTYAHAAKTGDKSLITKYHSLLQKWAEYLVPNSLNPNNAKSADDISYPNMSNLALKGILGVYSMGKIDEAVNPSNTTFKDKANELFSDWKQSAVTETHIQAEYGKPDTWGLMYNLFPAIWLETGLIDDDILNNEAKYYATNAPPKGQSYSLDSGQGHDIAYPHWALMTAAIIPSTFKSVRDTLIKSTYAQAYNVTQQFPLPLRYTVSTGDTTIGTKASAAQGAAFAIMAMSMPNVDIKANNFSPKGTVIGAIVGGVIGGLALILVIMGAIFFWRRRTRNVPDSKNMGYSALRPLNAQAIPSQPSSEPQYPMENMSHPSPSLVPLASKERGVLQRNELHQQHSESVMALHANTSLASEPGEGETLRAEVDDLRREVEAIRTIAQPPPIYQYFMESDTPGRD